MSTPSLHDITEGKSPREFLSYVLNDLSLVKRQSLMSDERLRRTTFLVNWPHDGNLSGIKMAQAGFYCVDDYDRVKCAFCPGSLYKWEVEDNPMTRHAKAFPFCRFVKGFECGNKEYKEEKVHSVCDGNLCNDERKSLLKKESSESVEKPPIPPKPNKKSVRKSDDVPPNCIQMLEAPESLLKEDSSKGNEKPPIPAKRNKKMARRADEVPPNYVKKVEHLESFKEKVSDRRAESQEMEASATDKITALQRGLSITAKEKEEVTEERNEWKYKCNKLEIKLYEYKQELKRKDELIYSFGSRLADFASASKALANSNLHLQELFSAKKALEDERERTSVELEVARAKLHRCEEKLQELQSMAQVTTQEQEHLEMKLEKYKLVIDKLEKEEAELEEHYQRLQEERENFLISQTLGRSVTDALPPVTTVAKQTEGYGETDVDSFYDEDLSADEDLSDDEDLSADKEIHMLRSDNAICTKDLEEMLAVLEAEPTDFVYIQGKTSGVETEPLYKLDIQETEDSMLLKRNRVLQTEHSHPAELWHAKLDARDTQLESIPEETFRATLAKPESQLPDSEFKAGIAELKVGKAELESRIAEFEAETVDDEIKCSTEDIDIPFQDTVVESKHSAVVDNVQPDSVLVQELRLKIAELEAELAGYQSDAGRGSNELRDTVEGQIVSLTGVEVSSTTSDRTHNKDIAGTHKSLVNEDGDEPEHNSSSHSEDGDGPEHNSSSHSAEDGDEPEHNSSSHSAEDGDEPEHNSSSHSVEDGDELEHNSSSHSVEDGDGPEHNSSSHSAEDGDEPEHNSSFLNSEMSDEIKGITEDIDIPFQDTVVRSKHSAVVDNVQPDFVLVQELELPKLKIVELETELAGYQSDAGRGSNELRDTVEGQIVSLTGVEVSSTTSDRTHNKDIAGTHKSLVNGDGDEPEHNSSTHSAKDGDEPEHNSSSRSAGDGDEPEQNPSSNSVEDGDEPVCNSSAPSAENGDQPGGNSSSYSAEDGDEPEHNSSSYSAKDGDEPEHNSSSRSVKNRDEPEHNSSSHSAKYGVEPEQIPSSNSVEDGDEPEQNPSSNSVEDGDEPVCNSSSPSAENGDQPGRNSSSYSAEDGDEPEHNSSSFSVEVDTCRVFSSTADEESLHLINITKNIKKDIDMPANEIKQIIDIVNTENIDLSLSDSTLFKPDVEPALPDVEVNVNESPEDEEMRDQISVLTQKLTDKLKNANQGVHLAAIRDICNGLICVSPSNAAAATQQDVNGTQQSDLSVTTDAVQEVGAEMDIHVRRGSDSSLEE